MGERYWITGVQLGLLETIRSKFERKKYIQEIIDKQFIGNFVSDDDKNRFEALIKNIK